MEDNFTRDEFEDFLRDQIRNHRMYPRDIIWREIHKKLHGDKKWPALSVAAILLFSLSVIISVYFKPKANIFSIKPSIEPVSASPSIKHNNNVLNNLTTSSAFSRSTIPAIVFKQQPNEIVEAAGVSNSNSAPPAIAINNNVTKGADVNKAVFTRKQIIAEQSGVKMDNAYSIANNSKIKSLISSNNNTVIISENAEITTSTKQLKETKGISPGKIDGVKNLKGANASSGVFPAIYKHKSSNSKFSYLVYAAPSISYRKLFEDRSMLKPGSAGPVGLNYVANVNNVVRHKPGPGIEAGISFMYNLSTRFRVKSGFQFNVRQYSIDAYRSTTEVASIALIRSTGIDTINTIAEYRNNNGYYSAKLNNRYYQLALPIGIEWEILGTKRIKLNIAASIQPTYLLNRNAYLLSTNFKNYTESPEIVRKWNINSNIETFISINSGDLKWQIGPQVRYQPYSTFIPQYPIKEHLIDYGIKIGVAKAIR